MDALISLEQTAARWLAQDARRRALEKAARTAYVTFAHRHPAWVAALFDEHFILNHLLPRLADAEERGRPLTPTAVAELWTRQIAGTRALRCRQQPGAIAMARAYLELIAQVRMISHDWRTSPAITV